MFFAAPPKQRRVERIPERDAAWIRSTQLITDLTAAVRELAENAVDAGATSIEVRVAAQQAAVSVADNGSGITASSMHELLTRRYTTSKVREVSVSTPPPAPVRTSTPPSPPPTPTAPNQHMHNIMQPTP